MKITETEARKMTTCPACGESKSEGSVVCWHCFKEHATEPLKYSKLSTNEWLDEYANHQ